MGNTKKVGTTGRFSSRYGVGIKKRVLAVERKANLPINCPFCGFAKIKRVAPGLYGCRKCEAKFTGGAYEPQTLVGKTINKMVSQKQFIAGAEELVKAKESSFSDIEREVEKALTTEEPSEEKKFKKKKEENVTKVEEEN
ncbi:MAG: 50S ribosomal protein L37ae [archaeon]